MSDFKIELEDTDTSTSFSKGVSLTMPKETDYLVGFVDISFPASEIKVLHEKLGEFDVRKTAEVYIAGGRVHISLKVDGDIPL